MLLLLLLLLMVLVVVEVVHLLLLRQKQKPKKNGSSEPSKANEPRVDRWKNKKNDRSTEESETETKRKPTA